MSESERQQLLFDWNDTATDYPKDKCIHQLFEEQVTKTPDAIAVVFENRELTYWELNERANQLAHYLQSLGVGAETLVGIWIERSLEMVVGLLGILKAGGAYVPLDPSYPPERLSYVINDAGIEILLTQESLLSALLVTDARQVCLDRDWETLASYPQSNPSYEVDVDRLAYVIYTSGSTGQPKGVLITHRSLINFTHSASDTYEITAKDRILQFASIGFDAAAEEIYPCLISGGSLVLRTEEMLSSHDQFLADCQALNLTVLDLPTAYWHQMVGESNPIESLWPRCLRLVIIGGEQAIPERVRSWQKSTGKYLQLVNSYGPTEATVVATIAKLSQLNSDDEFLSQISIGKPITNTQVYILDQHLQPVPIGVPGELHIGGEGLARGYLNRPELTAKKFIPNPFSPEKSSRLYKTGDLARYLPDGNIEFIGRIDNQVKIRGFRIELGEIESVLNTHPQVQQAVVIATEELSGNKRLVAYVVIVDKSLSTSQLREYLLQKLPNYMLPAVFVPLETLPLTPNGKVDRKALPLPDELNRKAIFIPPRNSIELRLAILWSDILNIDFIGVTDNFFELGGHSILAVNLMFQIQQKFKKNLPLATLFSNPTVEQLARLLHSEEDLLPQTALVPIKLNGNQSPIFFAHPSGGNILCYEHLASYLNLENPVYGLQSFGLDHRNEAHTSIEAMATHYVNEIRTVQPHGPYFLAGWSMGGLIVFEMAQQLYQKGEHIALVALIDSDPVSMTFKEPKDDATLLIDFFRGELDLSLEKLQQLETEKQLMYVLELAQKKNLILEDFNLAQASNLLRICKLNIQAADKYKPQHYSGLLTLFRASETAIEIESAWSKLADNIETYVVPANHQNIVKPPNVQILAQQLQALLGRVEGN